MEGDRSPIELAATPLASGGEGSLYRIESPNGYQHLVAKIYHPKKRTELRYKKILYLHEHPPKAFTDDQPITLVWPKQLLFDELGQFIGFLMPLVHGEKLELLCLPQIPKKHSQEWDAYEFAVDIKRKKRLDLCYKIAQAIYQIHSTERYILVDMKPDNIIVHSDGSVALVDLDSVEVVENGTTIYDAPVATPEYTPPDSYLKEVEVDPTQEDPWDRFGLAVIFYKLLLGVHPYAASATAPYDKYTGLYEKIEHGMFVHNPKIKAHLSVVPELHERFSTLPVAIQKLFERCFIDGHEKPFARPSSEEWVQVLQEYDAQYDIDNEKIKIPTLALDQLPNQLNLDKIFVIPTTRIISQNPKIQIDKPIDKKELKNHHLPQTVQDPKEIQSQRFFNFIILLLIVVVATALSLMLPWQLTLGLGIAAYLGFNYSTYRTRKSAERKDTIVSILNNQMSYFKEILSAAEGYEQKIASYIETIKTINSKNPKAYISNILDKRNRMKEKVEAFNQFIKIEKHKLRKISREGKAGNKELSHYYEQQVQLKTKLPQLEATTIKQKIILLKRAKRLGKLTDDEKIRYNNDLNVLEELQVQLELEQAELNHKHLEKSKDILYKCQSQYETLLEDIKIYHESIGEEEETTVKSLLEEQRTSLQELERLQYDLKQLEKPLDSQVQVCRRAKRDAELYKKINYPRHLLEMVGLAKPF